MLELLSGLAILVFWWQLRRYMQRTRRLEEQVAELLTALSSVREMQEFDAIVEFLGKRQASSTKQGEVA